MSSGWHSALVTSHPDEILPIAKSSGWLREPLSTICHPGDLLHRQWAYQLMHLILALARTLYPHCGPFVRESTRNAALWDWYCFVVRTSCWSINQSRRRWAQNCGTPVTTLVCHREIERLTLCSKIRSKQTRKYHQLLETFVIFRTSTIWTTFVEISQENVFKLSIF